MEMLKNLTTVAATMETMAGTIEVNNMSVALTNQLSQFCKILQH